MIIQSLDLSDFRNYDRLHMELEPGITIIYGDNAQGKTNLLEAVYLCSVNRSHRGARDREMIRFGCEEAHLKLNVIKKETDIRIDVHLRKNKNKGIAVNAVPVRRAGDFLGTVNCVLFSPEDLQIVSEGPAERRRFIDTELCILDKVYANAYIRYRKILEQRNTLLRDIYFEPSLKDTLSVWDEQLLDCGDIIIRRRKEFISELNEFTKPVHTTLSGGREDLELIYEPDVQAEDFREELLKSRDHDLKTKTTNVGPHRDDMCFLLKGDPDIDARTYGSQGQKRTCALSLKMAEIALVEKYTDDKPVLFLDDVLSELDSGRQRYLLESIRDTQTLITCTGLEDFVENQFEKAHVYKVNEGTVVKES